VLCDDDAEADTDESVIIVGLGLPNLGRACEVNNVELELRIETEAV
jgi:hypothetical protein